MIGSLLSSVIPSSSFGVQDSDGNDAPAVRAVISTSLTRGDATGSDVTGSEDGDVAFASVGTISPAPPST